MRHKLYLLNHQKFPHIQIKTNTNKKLTSPSILVLGQTCPTWIIKNTWNSGHRSQDHSFLHCFHVNSSFHMSIIPHFTVHFALVLPTCSKGEKIEIFSRRRKEDALPNYPSKAFTLMFYHSLSFFYSEDWLMGGWEGCLTQTCPRLTPGRAWETLRYTWIEWDACKTRTLSTVLLLQPLMFDNISPIITQWKSNDSKINKKMFYFLYKVQLCLEQFKTEESELTCYVFAVHLIFMHIFLKNI